MILKSHLQDFQSLVSGSTGGAISNVQIPATELSAAVSAGATIISVHDVGGFVVGQEVVIDDGTNRERRVIASITAPNITFTLGLVFSYAINTPVATKNSLFPDVTAQQALDGITIVRKFFRRNSHGTLTWSAVIAWVSRQFTNAAISIGLGIDHADDAHLTQGNMTAFSANAVVAAVSDGADSRTITIVGEDIGGGRQSVDLTLNGTTEVATTATFSRVYMVSVGAIDATRTITIRQGAGGTTRGTIGINRRNCWLWFGRVALAGSIVNAEGGDIATDVSGLRIGNIIPNGNIPIWVRLSVPSGSSGVANNTSFLQIRGETA